MMGAGKMARMALLLLFACAMKRIRAQSESPKGLHMFFSSEGGGRVSIHRPSETPITIPTSELESFHPDKNIFLDAALFAQKALNKNGYAYGTLSEVLVVSLDEDAIFPLTLKFGVREGEPGDTVDATLYLVTLIREMKFVGSGVAVSKAEQLGISHGAQWIPLTLDPPEEKGMLEKYARQLVMIMGVVVCASIFRVLRIGVEKGLAAWRSQKDTAAPAAVTGTTAKETKKGKARKKVQ